MRKEYFKFIGATHLLFIKDDKILLLRRFNTGYEDGNYSVPAGHVDGNERVTLATIREAQEETGILLTEQNLEMVHVMHRISPGTHPSGSDERIDFFFKVMSWDGEPKNREMNKCDDLSWFPLDHLPENMIPYVRAGIENYKNKKVFSEFGWN